MVKDRLINTLKIVLFFFILTICLVLFSPLLLPTITVGLTMFFEQSFWSLFFFITGLWFVFGLLMWMRGYGRKGDSA